MTDLRISRRICLEFGESSFKAWDGGAGFALDLEREENGRLTSPCRDRLKTRLQEYFGKERWRPKPRVFCAVSARGVSLRRVSLPAASREATRGLLLLQIEREFPLAPSELAWGYGLLNGDNTLPGRNKPTQEIIVIAVKREVLQDYADILMACGVSPVFTLGAFARSLLVAKSTGPYAMLDIGRTHSEFAIIEHGVPETIRVLRWGGEDLTRVIEKILGMSRLEAERFKVDRVTGGSLDGLENPLREALDRELARFSEAVRAHWTGTRLYLTGGGGRWPGMISHFKQALGPATVCERLEVLEAHGASAATVGLEKSQEDPGEDPLILQFEPAAGTDRPREVARWKWAALVGLVLLGLLSTRYTESLLLKPRLARRLSEVQTYRRSLPEVERELAFLQYLRTNQPAYLEALFVLADASPPGTRIETLSMNRRGDLAMRATMMDPQLVAGFRSKLIQSGLFQSVALEEQSMSPNQPQVIARFAGRWGTTNASK